jgi:hypothetical protein
MAAHILPQEVAEHLEAAIHLSNRRVYLRFLDEAEALIAPKFPGAAILVAGVVLESIVAAGQEQGTPDDSQQMERWLELRNRIEHAGMPSPSMDDAKEMVERVRGFLMRDIKVGPRLVPVKASAEAAEQLRGKYKFVSTSSDEFIRRKAEELRLEHDDWRF